MLCSEEAQRCYCGAEKCRGVIGTTKKFSPLKDVTNKVSKREKRRVFDDILVSGLFILYPGR
jgi:hypothetical protein